MQNPNVDIFKIRSNVRRAIINIIHAGFDAGYSVETVYQHIDEYIDFAEMIGIFDSGELRQQITEILEMRLFK